MNNLRIFIITMDDPLFTKDFIKDIVVNRHKNIVGLAVSKGGRLKPSKGHSRLLYFLTLFIIMGPWYYLRNVLITIHFKFLKLISRYVPVIDSPSISFVAKSFNIPVFEISNPNNQQFINDLKKQNPDIIINQSQYILKKELISIPGIGILNRHNALLPRNRGRLTPFWVIYKGEKETGVTIHFVDEGVDSGDIIVQERFSVTEKDTFNTLVRKNYKIASAAMLKALCKLENPPYDTIDNNDSLATYNKTPTLPDALKYRRKLIIRAFQSIRSRPSICS